MNKIPTEIEDRIVDQYLQGLSYSQILQNNFIGQTTLMRVLKRRGVPKKDAQKRSLIQSKIEEMRSLSQSGFSQYEIAKKVGFSQSTVCKYLHEEYD